MPLTSPTGAISRIEQTLAMTLADAPAFRTWCGAADQTAALARIYFGALPPPAAGGEEYTLAELVAYRPFALVFCKHGNRAFKASGQRYSYSQGGLLQVLLEQATPTAALLDAQEAERLWNNTVGSIVDDVCTLAGQGGYLAICDLDWGEPIRSHPDDVPAIGDAQQFWLQFHYGNQGGS